MDIVFIAIAAFVGAIIAGLLGWMESGEPFIGRKFASTIIRALVAGAVFAIGYQLAGEITVMDVFTAFVAGAGVDVIGNRAVGAIRTK